MAMAMAASSSAPSSLVAMASSSALLLLLILVPACLAPTAAGARAGLKDPLIIRQVAQPEEVDDGTGHGAQGSSGSSSSSSTSSTSSTTSSSTSGTHWWTGPNGEADPNLITDLPGAPAVPFAMASGYVTVDADAGRALFYWFVEADLPDPASAPLTLWLNGGPGCSSVGGGMLSELGPFYPTKDGNSLQVNPYSWNKVSNLLFLESPAGVGFSYSNTSADYRSNDAKTAADSYTFLLRFLARYPGLAASELYITGESYAGHYVPQLAQLIWRGADANPVNLRGLAIGNAWTDSGVDNLGAAFYWWTHALVSDDTFAGIARFCNLSRVGPLEQDDDAAAALTAAAAVGDNRECDAHLEAAERELGNINIYEIYVDVCLPGPGGGHARKEVHQLARHLGARGVGTRPILAAAAGAVGATDSYDPCVDDEVEAYLNLPGVQAALHANVSGGIPYRWTDCSNHLRYSYSDVLGSVLPIYAELLDLPDARRPRLLIYSGDTDAIVPVTGSRAWIGALERPVTAPWRPYYVGRQVGGYVTVYDKLTFATVRGAGHMVPYTQPARALHLFRAFVRGTRY